jgi:hypothetical protein
MGICHSLTGGNRDTASNISKCQAALLLLPISNIFFKLFINWCVYACTSRNHMYATVDRQIIIFLPFSVTTSIVKNIKSNANSLRTTFNSEEMFSLFPVSKLSHEDDLCSETLRRVVWYKLIDVSNVLTAAILRFNFNYTAQYRRRQLPS